MRGGQHAAAVTPASAWHRHRCLLLLVVHRLSNGAPPSPCPRSTPINRRSFNTSKRVVDEMVVSLARCTRPKLAVAADIALGRRKRAGSTPRTFCSLADIGPEAVALVEG